MKDFVKYDLALKLKEKGFDYKCLFVYNKEQVINPEIVKAFGELSDDGYYELTKEGGGRLDWDFVYIYEYQLLQYGDVIIERDIIRAPTISQVLNWLFEKKQLFISLDCNECDHFGLFFTIYKKDEETWVNCGFNDDYYNTPEEAAIGAIEYIVENLI